MAHTREWNTDEGIDWSVQSQTEEAVFVTKAKQKNACTYKNFAAH